MSDRKTEELARSALQSMMTVDGLIRILADPDKYKEAHDALAKYATDAVDHYARAKDDVKNATEMLQTATAASDENAKKSAKNSETTSRLASWETDLQRRENLLNIGNDELTRNIAAREQVLKKREDDVQRRENAVKREEQRIEQVKAETVARLGLSK